MPLENVGNVADAGAVNFLRGSAGGLSVANDQFLTQGGAILGVARGQRSVRVRTSRGQQAGTSQADLAIGVPLENVGNVADAGAVNFLRGSAGGLSVANDQFLTQGGAILGVLEANDRFGSALAAANMAGTSQADLAIGVPFENVGNVADAGAVNFLRGSAGGLSVANDQFLTQGGAILGVLEADSVRVRTRGREHGRHQPGRPGHRGAVGERRNVADAGAVNFLRGSAGGLSVANDQFLTQGGAILGVPRPTIGSGPH